MELFCGELATVQERRALLYLLWASNNTTSINYE